MSARIPVGVAGVGSYAPERVLTNDDLARMVDTSDEWIVQRTGIRERRIAGDGEDSGTMGTAAALRALEDAGLDAKDLDLIFCATTTPDKLLPTTACHIQDRIGAVNAGAFDLNSACSGFVFAFNTAAHVIAAGGARRVLVVGTETLSRIVNYEDRTTCVLFGDGAGAMVLAPLDEAGRGEYLGGSIRSEGGKDDVLEMPAGGSTQPASLETVKARRHFIVMGGNKVYRFAVSTFVKLIREAFEPYGFEQLGRIVPHQVNQRIIESALQRLDLPAEAAFTNIHKFGNTSAASVPMAFDEAYREGLLPRGKLVCSVAFGAGLSWGHFLLRW